MTVGTWTKLGINNTDTDDQAAFDAGNNRFVAPVDGTYFFGATRLFTINSSASARMGGRLVLNRATEVEGSYGKVSGAQVSEATALWLQTLAPLSAKDSLNIRPVLRETQSPRAVVRSTNVRGASRLESPERAWMVQGIGFLSLTLTLVEDI